MEYLQTEKSVSMTVVIHQYREKRNNVTRIENVYIFPNHNGDCFVLDRPKIFTSAEIITVHNYVIPDHALDFLKSSDIIYIPLCRDAVKVFEETFFVYSIRDNNERSSITPVTPVWRSDNPDTHYTNKTWTAGQLTYDNHIVCIEKRDRSHQGREIIRNCPGGIGEVIMDWL